jgi:hypothetical protein
MEYAYTFDHSSAINQNVERDPYIPNRFWFWYPPEWRTTNLRRKTIGFRSLWTACAKRHLVFTVNINKPNAESTSHEISVWMDPADRLVKIWVELDYYLKDVDHHVINVDWHELSRRRLGNIYQGENYAAYDSNTKVDKLGTNCFGIRFRLWENAPIGTTFTITDLNDDAKALFNVKDYKNEQTTPYNTLEFYDVWDRRSCLLKSNIVNSTMNNYLGYTKTRYNPLKYYQITNNDEKFYIDMYNGNNHDVISVLPYDGKDHLSLELVVEF